MENWFFTEQSVRDLTSIILTVRHESLSEALSEKQRAVHKSYQDFQGLKHCYSMKNEKRNCEIA